MFGLVCRADLSVQFVDLFQGKTFGLVNAKIDEYHADEATSTPNEENLGLKVGISRTIIHHIWGCEGDGKIEQPVGGSGHRKTFGTSLKRENLSRNHPLPLISLEQDKHPRLLPYRTGTPGGREEEDVKTNEGDENLVRGLAIGDGSDNGNDQLADTHTNSAETKLVGNGQPQPTGAGA